MTGCYHRIEQGTGRLAATLAAIVLISLAIGVPAQEPRSERMLIDQVQGGQVDWKAGVISATGEGSVSTTEADPARAYLRAKSYARIAAITHLFQAIRSLTVTSEQSAHELITRDGALGKRISASIQGVEILGENTRAEGERMIVQVTVGTRIFGCDSPGAALLEGCIKEENRNGAGSAKPCAKGGYTSLVIDAHGLGIARALSPRIRRDDKSELWGGSRDLSSTDEEMVRYACSLDDAKASPACGTNPLVIRACAVAGRNALCDAVVSTADAARILRENVRCHFLEAGRVIFVVDPSPAEIKSPETPSSAG